MSEPLTFVDTNILAYAYDETDPEKHSRARSLLDRLWGERAAVVSTQVLSELYSVMTRKLGYLPAEAREVVLQYTAWRVIEVDVPLLVAAMERNERDRVAWWDCLIVEAAMRAGAARLATEGFQPGRTFDGALEVMDPMAA